MRLWDAATGEPCATFFHPGIVPGLALRTGRTLAGDRELRG